MKRPMQFSRLLAIVFSAAWFAQAVGASEATVAAKSSAAPAGKVTRNALPHDLNSVAGMASLQDAGDAARDMLSRNGFVVLPKYYHQIFSPYVQVPLPPFVTMDSLHRTFHVILEEQVKIMETALAAEVAKISSDMVKNIRAYPAAARLDASSAQAGSLAETYFTVGALLLDAKVEDADPRAAAEIRLIQAAAGRAQSPLFGYEVDYSQFKPRGFYNDSITLQQYYRAMTWYGDMAFRQCSEPETRAARLIAERFQSVRQRWERLDRLYGHFIGPSDDLTPGEYADVLARTGQYEQAFAAEVAKLRDPKYNSMVLSPGQMQDWRRLTKGMRFLGKRYLPDGEIMMALAPSGLDVAAANGSPRAKRLLQAQGMLNAPETLRKFAVVQQTFSELKTSKEATHYAQFLRLTEALWMPPPAGAPEFMNTAAYSDKNLTTALAAWASMRHTWQLQAKQSVTYMGIIGRSPGGCVEPNIEFMQRLDALTGLTIEILKDVQGADVPRLEKFRALVADLREIAQKQLDGRPLVGKEEQLLQNYAPTIARLMYFGGNAYEDDAPLQWMNLIADVHTEHATGQALEVGTGGAMPIYVIVPAPGKPTLMVGGVYSYYEFPQPIAERLTDEAWRRRWEAGNIPSAPLWTMSYVAGVDVAPLLEKLKRGVIADELRYSSDTRIEEALTKELAPGGAFEKAEKRNDALWLLTARTGRKALPLLKEEAMKEQQSRVGALSAALAMVAEPDDLKEYKSRAMTSTGPDARVFAEAIAARRDADSLQMMADLISGAASRDARSVALRFIEDSGGKAATPLLLKTAATASDSLRDGISHTLARLWRNQPDDDNMYQPLLPAPSPTEEAQYRAQLVELSLDLLQSDKRADRSGGRELVVALNAEEVIPALEKLAFGPDKGLFEDAQFALLQIDSPAANPVLLRMFELPAADTQWIIERLTQEQTYMEAQPAFEKALDNKTKTKLGPRLCDWAIQGLDNLDPDGPGYYWFESRTRADSTKGSAPLVAAGDGLDPKDRLVRCWKTYVRARKGGGLARLNPDERAMYAEDLLVMTENVGAPWYARETGIRWTMQARPLAENLPPGEQRAALIDRCRNLQVKLTQDEVLWIKKVILDDYKRAFGDYPPETPGHWEKFFSERMFNSVDKARCNAEGRLCDPWGNPYRYLCVSKHSHDPFEIYSFGPDGKDDDGKEDDIVSWK